MSVITGDAVGTIRNLDDKEVLQQCMTVLRELFKEQVGFFLRHNIHFRQMESRDFPGLFFFKLGTNGFHMICYFLNVWCFVPLLHNFTV